MILIEQKPKQALNKAFLKIKPGRSDIEVFKANLIALLDRSNERESEEFHKNLVMDFLKKTYYDPHHFINTKGRNDLVVHNGHHAGSSVGVVLEAKKPTNRSEMLTTKKLNVKAFHELVLYYLRERISHNNLEVKHLVATNIQEWFVFDANLFDRLFAQNKNFVKQFQDFENGRLADTKTDFFYKQIAEPYIESLSAEIEFTYFNLQDYQKPLRNADPSDDTALIALFKLLSPEHLLKLPFANDSNTLDKRFYSELLHIIGLTEVKESGKKLIQRNKPGERHSGTILEEVIVQLDSLDKLDRLEGADQYGTSPQERLFHVALELSITWINRILFLKLLEAQLFAYHKGDKSYAFLHPDNIKSYDDLNNLFFQVLARPMDRRNDDVKRAFAKVPYLNSSLFEPTDTEQVALFISNLNHHKSIPIFSQTVLKDQQGKKRTGPLPTLEYLLLFLDAYDFGGEGTSAIQEDNKTLINASVLGLIFEKINGYRDGSFFTPGFITMYMCRETIRKAVVQKFNEAKGWDCRNMDDLYERIDFADRKGRNEANEIVNGLKICDPAVGSGHFLVSALNELIAVKNDLNILQDREGRRLKEYRVEVVNDELAITDEDGELFGYQPNNPKSQRIQETLFHEKQTLIENCLFGVDINANSVKICRLRLWIELLKNAYYVQPPHKTSAPALETLPNIDVNIKCGNSLVSRFAMDSDLKQALKKSKWTIESYRTAVSTYQNAHNKEQKREMERLLLEIKQGFSTEIRLNDPLKKRIDKIMRELYHRFSGTYLFEPDMPYGGNDQTNEKKRLAEKEKLEKELNQLNAKMDEIRADKIFDRSFEWRFEFPEVLDTEGDFVGFDVVIGNPPYIRQEDLGELKNHLKTHYEVFASGGDIFSYFYELGHRIVRKNGYLAFINNTFDKTTAGSTLRRYVSDRFRFCRYIDFTGVTVFDEATTYPIVLIAQKTPAKDDFRFLKVDKTNFQIKNFLYDESAYSEVPQGDLNPAAWNFIQTRGRNLLEKIQGNSAIKDIYGKCYYGIKTGLNEAFIMDKAMGGHSCLKPIFEGKDLKKWTAPPPSQKLILFENKSTLREYGPLSEKEALQKMSTVFPDIFQHLGTFAEKAKERYDKGSFWWELRNCAYYHLFEKPKIFFPNLQNANKFAFDETGAYLNAPAVFLPSDDLALLAILNSKVVWHFLTSVCVIRSGGYIEVKPQYFEQIPIPVVDPQTQKILGDLARSAIHARQQNPLADISGIEAQIDRLVYQLYGLTAEEVTIIEEKGAGGR